MTMNLTTRNHKLQIKFKKMTYNQKKGEIKKKENKKKLFMIKMKKLPIPQNMIKNNKNQVNKIMQ